MAPAWFLGELLLVHWVGPWAGSSVPRPCLKGTGQSLRAVSGFTARVKVCRPGSGRLADACLLPDPFMGKTAPWLCLIGPRGKLQGCYRICNQTKIGELTSRFIDKCVSWWVSRWAQLLMNDSWEGLEPSHSTVSGSAVRPSGWSASGGPDKYVSWQDPALARLFMGPGWEGLESSIWMFQDLHGCRRECLLLGTWAGRTGCRLHLGGPGAKLQNCFRIYSWTQFSQFVSRGSQAVAERGWGCITGHSGCIAWTEVCRLVIQGLVRLFLAPLALVLPPALYSKGPMRSLQVYRTISMSATWVWACLLKIGLFSLGLQWGFTVLYMDPKDPTKPLLSMDGCWKRIQIIVEKGYKWGTSYSTILLMSSFSLAFSL